MSRGNPKRGKPMISFRCPPDVRAAMLAYIAQTEKRMVTQSINQNQFIVQAIVEKLAHIERSKKNRKRKTAGEKAADAALALLM